MKHVIIPKVICYGCHNIMVLGKIAPQGNIEPNEPDPRTWTIFCGRWNCKEYHKLYHQPLQEIELERLE